MIPLLKGFLDYQEPDRQVIRGVILNRATKMTTALLKKPIEEQTGLKVIGYVPVLEACKVESRHLGLVMPENESLQRVNQLAVGLEKSIDLPALLEIAESALKYEKEACEIPKEVSARPKRLKSEAAKNGNEGRDRHSHCREKKHYPFYLSRIIWSCWSCSARSW